MSVTLNMPDQTVFDEQDVDAWETWLASQDDSVMQAFFDYASGEVSSSSDFSGVPSQDAFYRALDEYGQKHQLEFIIPSSKRMGGSGLLTSASASSFLRLGATETSRQPTYRAQAKDVAFDQIRFATSDTQFCNWLYNGMSGYATVDSNAGLTVCAQDYHKDLMDGVFGGVKLSTTQRDFMAGLFKGQTITLSSEGQITSAVTTDITQPSAVVYGDVDSFFEACHLGAVSAEHEGDTGFGNFVGDRLLDTGTDEEAIEALLRSYQEYPEEWAQFKQQVGLDFRAQGYSFEEIISREFAGGRELGYISGVIQSLNVGNDYYIGQSFGPMGERLMGLLELQGQINPDDPESVETYNQQFDAIKNQCVKTLGEDYAGVFDLNTEQVARVENLQTLAALTSSVRTLEQYQHEFPALLNAYDIHPPVDIFCWSNLIGPAGVMMNNVDLATSYFRRSPKTEALGIAFKEYMIQLNEVLSDIRAGQEPSPESTQSLIGKMGVVEREFQIFKTSEEAGREQLISSYEAAETGAYTVVGASIAITMGVYAMPLAIEAGMTTVGVLGTGMLAGTVAGTTAEFSLRSAIDVWRPDVDVTAERLGYNLDEASTNAACAALSLATGGGMTALSQTTKSGIIRWIATNPVSRNILTNEAIAVANAGMRADETFGLTDLLVAGGSGALAGVAQPALCNRALAELVFEVNREGFENIAEIQLEGGKLGAEQIIGAIAAGFTELGGSYHGSQMSVNQQQEIMLELIRRMQVEAVANGLPFNVDAEAIRRGEFDPQLLATEMARLASQRGETSPQGAEQVSEVVTPTDVEEQTETVGDVASHEVTTVQFDKSAGARSVLIAQLIALRDAVQPGQTYVEVTVAVADVSQYNQTDFREIFEQVFAGTDLGAVRLWIEDGNTGLKARDDVVIDRQKSGVPVFTSQDGQAIIGDMFGVEAQGIFDMIARCDPSVQEKVWKLVARVHDEMTTTRLINRRGIKQSAYGLVPAVDKSEAKQTLQEFLTAVDEFRTSLSAPVARGSFFRRMTATPADVDSFIENYPARPADCETQGKMTTFVDKKGQPKDYFVPDWVMQKFDEWMSRQSMDMTSEVHGKFVFEENNGVVTLTDFVPLPSLAQSTEYKRARMSEQAYAAQYGDAYTDCYAAPEFALVAEAFGYDGVAPETVYAANEMPVHSHYLDSAYQTGPSPNDRKGTPRVEAVRTSQAGLVLYQRGRSDHAPKLVVDKPLLPADQTQAFVSRSSPLPVELSEELSSMGEGSSTASVDYGDLRFYCIGGDYYVARPRAGDDPVMLYDQNGRQVYALYSTKQVMHGEGSRASFVPLDYVPLDEGMTIQLADGTKMVFKKPAFTFGERVRINDPRDTDMYTTQGILNGRVILVSDRGRFMLVPVANVTRVAQENPV
ncbi:MAG TPA: hypothetical protein VJC18_03285, partial [bacterium]|nr:hypothetical protein [bacterium]